MNLSIKDNPRYNWLLLVGLLVLVYLVINLWLRHVPVSASIRTYILQPVIWGLVAWAVLTLPGYRPAGGLRIRNTILQLALIVGGFQVVLYVIGGLFSSFGRSPYAFTPTGVLTNLFFVGSMLIGMEFSRAWLVNRLGKKHTFLALAFVAVLYAILALPLARLMGIKPEIQSITYVNSTVLPTLAESMFASFLALLGGPLASLAYRGILQAFWWFSPILPDLPWAFKGIIGVVTPVVGLVAANTIRIRQPRQRPARREREGSLGGWVVTTVIAIAIIWFAAGLFPIRPSTIISGSMRPTYEVGDVVFVAKVSPNIIQPGDILHYREAPGITAMHRVVEIQELDGRKVFITQGDANTEPDPNPVLPGNVIGRALFSIPRVGWASIAIREFIRG